MTDNNNVNEFSKKELIKSIFDDDKNLDFMIVTENNLKEYKNAKIKGLSN